MFLSVGFVGYTNNAQEVIILEYAKSEYVSVQRDSHLLIWRVKKVMLCKNKKKTCMCARV